MLELLRDWRSCITRQPHSALGDASQVQSGSGLSGPGRLHDHVVLRARLATFPVVVVTGARQTGKSTLARELEGDARTYLTLDDYSVLDQALRAPEALINAGGFSSGFSDGFDRTGPPLTLDEIQRAPDLLLTVKRAVDARRTPDRFLLIGSANLDLMRGVSGTLAGRAVYVTLWPMTRREAEGEGCAGSWDILVDESPGRWLEALADTAPVTSSSWEELVARGGYPFPALQLDAHSDREAWFEAYLRTYLERDLRQLAAIDNLVGFQRIVRAVSHRLGSLMNQASLARDAGLPPTTAQRYLHLLETSYQLLRVEAYSVNRTKRLVKSPKLYWCDPGLALHLAGETIPGGAHLENLIACDLFAWRETRSRRPNILFWRTSKGAEVDFVIETPQALVPMEVKSSRTVRVSDARHLQTFMDEYGDRVPAGILTYAGRRTYWLTDRVLAVPWHVVI